MRYLPLVCSLVAFSCSSSEVGLELDSATLDARLSDLRSMEQRRTDVGGDAGPEPTPPAALVRYLTGDEADAEPVAKLGGELLLAGGGRDVDAAMKRWLAGARGGDVVVLRTSGSDGYNSYLYSELGAKVDSVETLLPTTRALADHPYVRWRLERAEAIFIAGGDQSSYLAAWAGTGVEAGLAAAAARGTPIGGTSAGLAILGQFVFSAAQGTVTSAEALANPYRQDVTLERDFLALPRLAGWITDTHFAERDRMGRLVTFLARLAQDGWASAPLGLGVDEESALLVDAAGQGTVYGSGKGAYVVRSTGAPTTCKAGSPLTHTALELVVLRSGDTVQLPGGATASSASPLGVTAGALSPTDPY